MFSETWLILRSCKEEKEEEAKEEEEGWSWWQQDTDFTSTNRGVEPLPQW